MAQPLKKRSLFAYGLFALPLAFASMPIYIHAPEFYAVEYGVSLAALGIVLLVMRLIDAGLDPLLGAVIDQSPKRHYALSLSAMFLFILGFWGLFHPAYFPEEWLIINFAASLFIVTLAYSFLSILLNTLGGIWSEDASQHTRITTMREGIGLIGLLLAAALPSLLQRDMSASQAFHIVGATFCLFTVICGAAFLWWQRAVFAHASQQTEPQKVTLHAYWQVMKEHATFYGIYFISVFASSIPAVLVLFFIRDRLGASEDAGLFLLLYFLAGAAGMPLWHWLSGKIGQIRSWGVSMAIAIVSFIWAYFLGDGDLWQYGVICAVSGIAFGAELSLPPAILAGSIADGGAQSAAGKRYALLMFCFKASVAIAAGLTLPALEWVGYVPAQDNSEAALHALSITYALIPCGLKAISFLMLLRHSRNV